MDARTYDTVFVGGRFMPATSGRSLDVIAGRSEERIGSVPLASVADVDRAVAAARAAFDDGPWPRMAPAQRAAALRRLADGLEARADELVELGVEENGYPIGFSQAYMAPNPVFNLRFYADLAESYAFEEHRNGAGMHSLVRREPVGVVAAIPPFNGPLRWAPRSSDPRWPRGAQPSSRRPTRTRWRATCWLRSPRRPTFHPAC